MDKDKMDFQEQQRLFNVRKTVLEMLKDRGYKIPITLETTFEEFRALCDAKNHEFFIHDPESDKKVFVSFHNTKSFGKNELKNLWSRVIQKYEDESIHIILLLKDKENSMVAKELMKPIYQNVEIFLQENMVFNITHHVLVPKHILLNTEEENEVLSKYNTTKAKLPKILKSDPVARYYGMKTDQICKIIRKSSVSGETIYYRVVK